MSFDIKLVNDIRKKIEREKNIINSSTKIRETTSNVAVKQKCNSNIREAKQNLEYLTKTLDDLSLRSVDSQGSANTLVNTHSDNQLSKHYNTPNFTRLDLIKYDCPSLGHRIQYMLQQLEFKLQIENQYKEASEKMIKLYQFDADNHSSSAALGGRIESNKKIPLLTRALKRYRDMHIDIVDVREETELLSNQRLRGKPLTGVVTIGISNLKDIDHIVSSSLTGKKCESVILIKVDDELKVKTKSFRNGKLNESLLFQINVDKNNEIEISVCDKVNGDQLVPVAIVWFQIGDIVEELRRKRKHFENSNNGWVSASNLTARKDPGYPSASPGLASSAGHPHHPPHHHPHHHPHHQQQIGSAGSGSAPPNVPKPDAPINFGNTATNNPAQGIPRDITSSAWYILEPSGQILLTFGFVKTDHRTGNRIGDNNLGGLGRHGAIRERKDNVYEQFGHHFVQKNFYNIMMCAYCGEFARYSCYQCQDCRYLCHKKCYKNVVTKCISKSSTEIDPDEAKLNHKIPHRFEPITNRGTKWCCHCGFILPWGKKNVRKCSECGVMCHAQCAHLVPDFCGMSMIMANKILTTIKQSGSKSGSPVRHTHRLPPQPQQQTPPYHGRPSFDDINASPVSHQFPSGVHSGGSQFPVDHEHFPPQRQHQLQQQSQPQEPHTHPYNQGGFHQPVQQRSEQTKKSPFPQVPGSGYQNGLPPLPSLENESELPPSSAGGAAPDSGIPSIVIESDYDQTSLFASERDHKPQSQQPQQQQQQQQQPPLGIDVNYPESEASSVANPFENEEHKLPEHPEPTKTDGDVASSESPVAHNEYYNDYNTENISKRLSQIEMGSFTGSQPLSDNGNIAKSYDGGVEPISLDPIKNQQPVDVQAPIVPERDAFQQQQSQPLEQQVPIDTVSHSTKHHKKEKHHRRRKVGLDDFQFLAVLGKGNFGKVMLAESRHSKKLCAIKVLKKDFIIENDEVESTKSEKRVFLIANRKRHPFLINLHCCFQTANRIYFVMEYVSGGDLMWHIQKARFSQRRAQFYAAEVLLGLKYFHDNGVIYRDLKLDNILLTTSGHIKIADYGLCKEEMWYGNTTSTFCGTPEFMAPEILKEQKYGKAVDWWAFGVLLYQMLLGQSPFRGGDEEEIFNAILTDEPLYPIQMARESVEILQALLTRDPTQRLGAGPRDAEEVMEHPYFRNISFDDVLNLRIPPPYLPEVKSEHDISNFDDEFTAETPRLTPVNSTLDSSMQEKFRGFSHMSDDYL